MITAIPCRSHPISCASGSLNCPGYHTSAAQYLLQVQGRAHRTSIQAHHPARPAWRSQGRSIDPSSRRCTDQVYPSSHRVTPCASPWLVAESSTVHHCTTPAAYMSWRGIEGREEQEGTRLL